FDDRNGKGGWICNQCGAGDGFALLKLVHGWDFAEAATRVEDIVGNTQTTPRRPEQSDAERRALLKRLWLSSTHVTPGGPVDRYLRSRKVGLSIYPDCLRTCSDETMPMMVALV